MEQNSTYNGRSEISVTDLLFKLIEKWYIVVTSLLVFVLYAVIYVKFFCTPMYSSTAKLFIFNTESVQQSTSEITISTYLARDYAELITDRTVLEDVIKNLNLDYNYNALKSAVTINNPEGTRILEITVQSPDANRSKRIADEICVVAQEKIVELMGIGRVNIISEGFVPKSPSSPIMRKYVTTAAVSALIFSAIVVFIMFITNDKIESEDDINKYLELSVLATIPYNNTSTKKKSAKISRKRAK